jgi:hypothetical protein
VVVLCRGGVAEEAGEEALVQEEVRNNFVLL